MEKKFFSIGVTLLLLGIFLIFAFWPITATSARALAEESDDGYEEHETGETVRVYGTITDVTEISLLNRVVVELDGELSIEIEGQEEIEYVEGEEVYGEIEHVDVISFEELDLFSYWRLEGELNSKRTIDFLFYGVAGAGIAVAAVGAVKE